MKKNYSKVNAVLGTIALLLGILVFNLLQTGSIMRKKPSRVHVTLHDIGSDVMWDAESDVEADFNRVIVAAWDAPGAIRCQASGDDVQLVTTTNREYLRSGVWNGQETLSPSGEQLIAASSKSRPFKTELDLVLRCYRADGSPVEEALSYVLNPSSNILPAIK